MNDISPMDKTFLILTGIIVIGHLVDKFIEYLRYKERLKNEYNILWTRTYVNVIKKNRRVKLCLDLLVKRNLRLI